MCTLFKMCQISVTKKQIYVFLFVCLYELACGLCIVVSVFLALCYRFKNELEYACVCFVAS